MFESKSNQINFIYKAPKSQSRRLGGLHNNDAVSVIFSTSAERTVLALFWSEMLPVESNIWC